MLALCAYSYTRGHKSARIEASRADKLRDLAEEREEERQYERQLAEEKRRPSGAPKVGDESDEDACDGTAPSDWELGKAYYAPDRRAFKHYPAVYVGGEWTRTE